MSTTRKLLVPALAVFFVAVWGYDVEAKRRKPKGPKIATGLMDEGALDPFWFGTGLEFRTTGDVDYLWVKEGFSFTGRTLHFLEWSPPEFMGEDAGDHDTDDLRLATIMSRRLPELFMDEMGMALGGRAETSLSAGDVEVLGRVVECSTGNRYAKMIVGFGAGAGYTTIDLKFVDAATGELLVAVHHRVVSGTTMSTTDGKFARWVATFSYLAGRDGLGNVYARGKPTRK